MDNNISSSEFEMRGVIKNLSTGGCVVETAEEVEQGKYIILAFQIGSNFIQGIQGRLVRQKVTSPMPTDDEDVSNFNSAPQKTTKECIISFNAISSEHEKIIVDFVMNAQRQFEINLGLTE